MPKSATPTLPDAATPATQRNGATALDLDGDEGLAFAIDVAACRIVAASPAARGALGIAPRAALPIALDSAMPALQRLRTIAGLASQSRETLAFWSFDGRIETRAWDVAPVGGGAQTTMVLVRAAPHGAAQDIASPAPRDDAETLKDMARRIREGRLDGPKSMAMPLQSSPFPIVESATTGTALPPASSAMAPADLARLAHELKTPLTAIAAAAEIMRDERIGAMGNPRYLDYARDIHESAAHALAVIAQLLARGAGRDGERDRIAAIDLNNLVARTVATLQPIAAERRITLAFDAADSAPAVTASPTALRQILLNLLSNALKFTPARGDVRAVTGYLADGGVFLAVRDTGDGIDDDAVRRALSVDDAQIAERPGGGHGIGLQIACRLVADIGARIEFDSEPGKGTVALIAF
ncbi:MAG: sensor histidine kinase [Hyphomicrobium sp.]